MLVFTCFLWENDEKKNEWLKSEILPNQFYIFNAADERGKLFSKQLQTLEYYWRASFLRQDLNEL